MTNYDVRMFDNDERTIELTERFDVDKARQLLLSDLLDAKGKRILKNYLTKLSGNAMQVQYTNESLGRLEANVLGLKKNETCSSQMNLWNVMKAVGCSGIYTDIDIVNCHPVLIQQLFESEGYDTQYLKSYVSDRAQLITDMKVTKNDIKKLMYGLMYNPVDFKPETWMKECKVDKLPELFTSLEQEMKDNVQKILSKYPDYRKEAQTKKSSDYWNLDGSAFAYLAQQAEKTCLLCMYDFLRKRKYTIGALIHDGMHVQGKVSQSVLDECSQRVYDDIGFRVQIVPKEFDNFDEQLNNVHTVETDCDAAEIIVKHMESSEHDLVVSKGRMYWREDDMYICDASKDHDDIQTPLMNYINTFYIFKDGKTPVSLTRNMGPAKNVREAVFNRSHRDEDFADKINEWSKCKLCYKNGYYDFQKGQFMPYDTDVFTTIRINRDYDDDVSQKDIDELYNRVLQPIFAENQEMLKYFLDQMARVMAGHVEDKQWFVMIGERNCGKGVLTMLFRYCFQEYVQTTAANNFISKTRGSDDAMDKKWVVPLDKARAVFTNEVDMRTEDKKTTLNGAMLKEILGSGGDELTVRTLHKTEVKFSLQCQFVMMCNDLPESNDKGAMSNCKEFHMESQFVDGEPKENCIVKEYKKDDSIKDYIKTERAMKAFTHILFKHYSSTKPKDPVQIKEACQSNTEESELSQFKELYNFTNKSDDFITILQFNYILEDSGLSTTKKKAKIWLKKMGIKETTTRINSKVTKVYKGIKALEDEESEYNGGVTFEAPSDLDAGL